MNLTSSWAWEANINPAKEAEFTRFAEEIARNAGNILLKGFRSPDTVVSYKSPTNIVTSIDTESEEYIVSQIRKRFPGHAVVAEEGSRLDEKGEYLWYVDPLDGTNNFAHGIPVFSVSIGVYSRVTGKMVSGVVYDPFHNELFSATRGSGAFLNTTPIQVSATADLGISMMATGFPYDVAESDNNNLHEFNRMLPHIQGIRRLGSAAIDLAYVACGRFEGFWEPKLKPWDSAGGSLLVEEAGGRVTRYNGTGYDPEFPEMLASNGRIHDSIMRIILA